MIDAHVHVWEIARRPQPWIDPRTMAVLDQDHLLPALVAELDAAGVAGAVLVQVLNRADETDDYLWVGRSERIVGVVGWTDVLAPDLDDELGRLAEHPSGTRLVGVRHVAVTEPDPEGWLRAASSCGAWDVLGRRGLVVDLMVLAPHLPVVAETVARHPGTTFVLDHAGKAPIASGWGSEASWAWCEAVAAVAAQGNVVCKLSGLTTMARPGDWKVADLAPYVEHLLAHFGPDRLAFGSDWPVSLRAGSYRRTVRTVRDLVSVLSPDEQSDVLSGVARRTYGLPGRCDPTEGN